MVKTTIELRDDIHSALISRFGKRKLSETINRILAHHLLDERKGLFGSMKKTGLQDLRDHHDRV